MTATRFEDEFNSNEILLTYRRIWVPASQACRVGRNQKAEVQVCAIRVLA